jgi:Tfp pilus assembly major pilin PilA
MNLRPRYITGSTRAQQGFTLIGLLFWAVVVAALALLMMKVAPALSEYRTIQSMVNKAAHEGGSTVPEIRATYDRYAQIEYGVDAIKTGRDLDIAKEDDKVVISFAYDKEIPLFEPVFLVIKFKGQSK